MRHANVAPAEHAAGAQEQWTVGRPVYSPGWGRWIVPLGPGVFRTATTAEVARVKLFRLAGESRIDRSTNKHGGQ